MKLKINLLIIVATGLGLAACVQKAQTSSPIIINYSEGITCGSTSLLTWSGTGTFQCADSSNGAVVTVYCPIGYAFPNGVPTSLIVPAVFKYDNNSTVAHNIIGFQFTVGSVVADTISDNGISSINAGASKNPAIQTGSGSSVINYVNCVSSSNYSDWSATTMPQ